MYKRCFIRRMVDLIIRDWKRWQKEVSSKIYETRTLEPEVEIMKETPWSRIRGQNSVDKEFLEILGSGKVNGQVSNGETIAVSVHDINKRGKMTQPNPSPNSFMQQNEKKASRTWSTRGKSPSGKNVSIALQGWPCKDYLKGTCINSFCEKWHHATSVSAGIWAVWSSEKTIRVDDTHPRGWGR